MAPTVRTLTGTDTTVDRHEEAALRRAARLEALLGDPGDPANPHGLKALFAAARRQEPPWPTEQLLTEAGVGAEFVPAAYGGRLTRADLLAKVVRPVFRRDVMLGFGFGITSLFAGAAVWAAGSEQQRRWTASVLLGGGRAAILHHEVAHANSLLRGEFTARPVPGGHVLNGRKDVIINAERAAAYVVYARTGPGRAGRSHSVLLLDPGRLPGGAVRRLPRVAVPGARGALFSGLEFTGCRVDGALVGRSGEGVALALRTFQVNRCLISSLLTAAAGTVLQSAVQAATTGRRSLARRWHRPLAGVFADLLACDSMATVALRSLSLLPGRAHTLAAAVKYVVPALIREDLEELTPVFGARGYQHDSAAYGSLDKLAHDLSGAGLGHAGTAACQAVIVPRLRRLARSSWFADEEPPPGLFRPGTALPDLDYRLLRAAGGGDFLAAALVGAADRLAAAGGSGGRRALGVLARLFAGELRALQAECRELPPSAAGTRIAPAACALSDRYALVLAAAAVLGVWEGQDGSSPFLASPAWALLALSRIGSRLGIPVPDLPGGCVGQVLEELVHRFRTGRGCDLDAVQFLP